MRSARIASTRPSRSCGTTEAALRERSPSSRIGIQRIRLAVGPPRPSIRAVDLDDEDPCLTQLSSQAGTIGAGALDTDSVNLAVALQPLHQGAIGGRRCRKLPIAELTSKVIDHGGMVALSIRVHATSHTNRRPCHACHAIPLPFAAVRWAHAAVGIGGQATDGRLLRRLL
jgi:hypothetical protein